MADDPESVERQTFVGLSRLLKTDDRTVCLSFLSNVLSARTINKSKVLSTLPLTSEPSCVPLSLLSVLLVHEQSWPVLELVRCYTRTWKHLPEDVKAGRCATGFTLAKHVHSQVLSSYDSLATLLPQSDRPALVDGGDGITALTHSALRSFVQTFRLPVAVAKAEQPVVAIALPNGPLLGLALLAVSQYFTAAPLSASSGAAQFKSDITQAKATVVLVAANDVDRLSLTQAWVEERGLEIVVVKPNTEDTFDMIPMSEVPVSTLVRRSAESYTPNAPSDVALLLFTSGTSGTKKTVPISLHTIISGAAFVVDSWGLTPQDICLNMMPLFHV